MERILTVNFDVTQARADRAAPTINCEGSQWPTLARASQAVAVAAAALNPLPAPFSDEVDMLYYQLAEPS
jgi:hypothetical protein